LKKLDFSGEALDESQLSLPNCSHKPVSANAALGACSVPVI
jgi:hypothetical protein